MMRHKCNKQFQHCGESNVWNLVINSWFFFMDPWCLHVAKLLVKCQALAVVLFIFFYCMLTNFRNWNWKKMVCCCHMNFLGYWLILEVFTELFSKLALNKLSLRKYQIQGSSNFLMICKNFFKRNVQLTLILTPLWSPHRKGSPKIPVLINWRNSLLVMER